MVDKEDNEVNESMIENNGFNVYYSRFAFMFLIFTGYDL